MFFPNCLCCPTGICGSCCSAANTRTSYTVDMGVGGWANAGSALCTSLNGDVVVTGGVASCVWTGTAGGTVRLSIETSGGNCYWRVRITLSCIGLTASGCDFETSPDPSFDCTALPITLTKVAGSETHGGCCTGTLPGTITVDV